MPVDRLRREQFLPDLTRREHLAATGKTGVSASDAHIANTAVVGLLKASRLSRTVVATSHILRLQPSWTVPWRQRLQNTIASPHALAHIEQAEHGRILQAEPRDGAVQVGGAYGVAAPVAAPCGQRLRLRGGAVAVAGVPDAIVVGIGLGGVRRPDAVVVLVGSAVAVAIAGGVAGRAVVGPTARRRLQGRELGGVFRLEQRVDGFVSADFAYTGGVLTTEPFVFGGNCLALNLNTSASGEARVAILDADGSPIEGFGADKCDITSGDYLSATVFWRGSADVSALAGRPVRLRFEMRGTKLYSFQFRQVEEPALSAPAPEYCSRQRRCSSGLNGTGRAVTVYNGVVQLY